VLLNFIHFIIFILVYVANTVAWYFYFKYKLPILIVGLVAIGVVSAIILVKIQRKEG